MQQPSKTTASALCVFSLFILLLAGCRKEITPARELLKQVLMQEHATLDVTALSYALTGIALTDAAIGCWQAKYRYQVERPITYIRNVLVHSSWLSLLATPNHPDYPSGHLTVSGAFATMMTEMFGEDYHFVDRTYDYLGMAPRTFTSFRHLSEEIGMSRVYAGIHNRNACENGRAQGEAVAKNLLYILQFKK